MGPAVAVGFATVTVNHERLPFPQCCDHEKSDLGHVWCRQISGGHRNRLRISGVTLWLAVKQDRILPYRWVSDEMAFDSIRLMWDDGFSRLLASQILKIYNK